MNTHTEKKTPTTLRPFQWCWVLYYKIYEFGADSNSHNDMDER